MKRSHLLSLLTRCGGINTPPENSLALLLHVCDWPGWSRTSSDKHRGGGWWGGRQGVLLLLQKHTVGAHTLRHNLGLAHKRRGGPEAPDPGTGTIRPGVRPACCSHGEVSDPHHHPGERAPAYDQPLLPGREGARAEPRAPDAGQGSGRPAPVPRPDGAAGVRQQQPSFWHPAAMCSAQQPPR